MNVILLVVNSVALVLLIALGVYKKLYVYNYFRRIVAVLVFMCLVMALSFVTIGADEEQSVANRDIIFVPDFTYSMNALDDRGGKSRLDVMQEDILAIGKNNAGARYGIFPIDINPSIYMPMTTTYSDLEIAVKTITPPYDYVSRGTVWPQLSVTLQRLSEYIDKLKKYDKSREVLVVVMSDYEIAKGSDEKSDKIIEAASDLKGRICGAVVVGYGRDNPVNMPTVDWDWGTNKQTVDKSRPFAGPMGKSGDYEEPKTARDESNARKIAESMGGIYVASENTSNIDEAVRTEAKQAYKNNLKSDQSKKVHQGMFYLLPAAVFVVWLCVVEVGKNYSVLAIKWGNKK